VGKTISPELLIKISMLNYWEMMRSNIIRWIKQRCRCR